MAKTITKADIVEYLHTQLGLNKSESKKLIEDFFDEIKDSLARNEEVKLSGFGNFELLNKKLINNGDFIGFQAIGGGLSWGSSIVRIGKPKNLKDLCL